MGTMKIDKTESTDFTPLHDLFCGYESHRVRLNYDKKELVFNLTVYGNHPDIKLERLFRNSFSTIGDDKIEFKKHVYITNHMLTSYLTSKTHKAEIKDFILDVLKNYKIFTEKSRDDESLISIDESFIANIELLDLEMNRYKDFINKILKTGKIPRRVKPYKIYDCSLKIPITIKEFLKLYETINLEDIKKYFKPDQYGLTYKSIHIKSLNDLNLCLDFGFNIDQDSESIKILKSVEIFSDLGCETSEAV